MTVFQIITNKLMDEYEYLDFKILYNILVEKNNLDNQKILTSPGQYLNNHVYLARITGMLIDQPAIVRMIIHKHPPLFQRNQNYSRWCKIA